MNTLTYKGYQGRFEYPILNADIFHGEVLHLNDVDLSTKAGPLMS